MLSLVECRQHLSEPVTDDELLEIRAALYGLADLVVNTALHERGPSTEHGNLRAGSTVNASQEKSDNQGIAPQSYRESGCQALSV